MNVTKYRPFTGKIGITKLVFARYITSVSGTVSSVYLTHLHLKCTHNFIYYNIICTVQLFLITCAMFVYDISRIRRYVRIKVHVPNGIINYPSRSCLYFEISNNSENITHNKPIRVGGGRSRRKSIQRKIRGLLSEK